LSMSFSVSSLTGRTKRRQMTNLCDDNWQICWPVGHSLYTTSRNKAVQLVILVFNRQMKVVSFNHLKTKMTIKHAIFCEFRFLGLFGTAPSWFRLRLRLLRKSIANCFFWRNRFWVKNRGAEAILEEP
jgi:hypothetical protein